MALSIFKLILKSNYYYAHWSQCIGANSTLNMLPLASITTGMSLLHIHIRVELVIYHACPCDSHFLLVPESVLEPFNKCLQAYTYWIIRAFSYTVISSVSKTAEQYQFGGAIKCEQITLVYYTECYTLQKPLPVLQSYQIYHWICYLSWEVISTTII
jgi:hypothetical protein